MLCRTVNAYSINGYEPKEPSAEGIPSAAAMPEGLFQIEDDEEPMAEEQAEQQQGFPEDRAQRSMSFLS